MISLMMGDGGVAVYVCVCVFHSQRLRQENYQPYICLDLYLAEALCHQREQRFAHMFAVFVK